MLLRVDPDWHDRCSTLPVSLRRRKSTVPAKPPDPQPGVIAVRQHQFTRLLGSKTDTSGERPYSAEEEPAIGFGCGNAADRSPERSANADQQRFTRQPRAVNNEDVERVVTSAVRHHRVLITNARDGKLGPVAWQHGVKGESGVIPRTLHLV
jgi:hypothetical protein